MTTRKSIRRPLIIVLSALVLGALVLWAALTRGNGEPATAAAAPATRAASTAPVVVANASAARDDVMIDVIGSGLASTSVTIFPAASGEVARVLFSSGMRVKKDQLLVQLVDRSEQLAVDLASTRADAARRLLERYERTRGSGAVSATVIDEARLALRQAEIELAQAREQLRNRTVQAPFTGVVGIAQVDPGDRITPDTPITTLDDRAQLSVAFRVPEPFLSRLEAGQTVVLHNIAFPGREFEGRLSHIDSRVDPVTRTVGVRASVPNQDDLLRPGMSFSVRLPLPGESAIRVAELAVQWGREGSHVWVVRDGAAIKVPVRVQRRLEGAVLVSGEVAAGEAVVVEGFHRLRPERAVRVVQQRESPSAAPQSQRVAESK